MCFGGSASAQDIDFFSFSGGALDARGTLQLASPHIGQNQAWYSGIGIVLAGNPLVIERGLDNIEAVVSQQLSARALLGYNLGGFARLDLEMPAYPLVVQGEEITRALGDLQISATIPLSSAFAIALVPLIRAPTAQSGSYVDGGMAGGISLTASTHLDPLTWVVDLGFIAGENRCLGSEASDCKNGVVLGQSLRGGGGFQYRIFRWLVAGSELNSRLALVEGAIGDYTRSPVEVHAFAQAGDGTGVTATLAAGTGLVAGIGAPSFRIAAAVGWRSTGEPPDWDLDGLPDEDDPCPQEAEDVDGYQDHDGCIDPDNDRDGILDEDDECPDQSEDTDNVDDEDGCPGFDNDHDGLLDVDDQCPTDYGPPQTLGCPDRDGDRVPDSEDDCPTTPGTQAGMGCP